jgi:membrane protein
LADRFGSWGGGWWGKAKALVVQTGKDFLADNGIHFAAALSYYAFLSLFPLLLAGASIASYFVDPGWAVEQASSLLGEYAPETDEIVEQAMAGIVQGRDTIGIVSILVLLWVGSNVFGALATAMNVVCVSEERHGVGRRLLVRLKMTVLFGGLFLLSLAAPFVVESIWNAAGAFPRDQGILFGLLRWALPALLLLVTFTLVYRYVPAKHLDWEASVVGAMVASVIFMIVREGFVLWVRQFAALNLVYGPLAAATLLLIWWWLAALITLFCGALASHYEQMVERGRSAEEVGREHRERSLTRPGSGQD